MQKYPHQWFDYGSPEASTNAAFAEFAKLW